MALQVAFEDVQARLKELQEALLHLHFSVVEARSPRIDHHLADRLGDQVIPDLQGLTKDALLAAETGAAASSHSPDAVTCGRALLACQKIVNQMVEGFWTELGSYRPIADLIGLGEERNAEWQVWTHGVLNALDACQQPAYHVSEAVLQCWQELLERIGTTSISVRATNIGQQIGLSEEDRAAVKSAT